jgi:hypothetical protein
LEQKRGRNVRDEVDEENEWVREMRERIEIRQSQGWERQRAWVGVAMVHINQCCPKH